MKKEHKILLIGIVAIAVLDTAYLIACLQYHYSFTNLWMLNLLIYFAAAYEGARRWNVRVGIFLAVSLSIFETLFDWLISFFGGPDPSGDTSANSPGVWLIRLLIVIAVATLIGLLASGLAFLSRKDKNAS